MARGRTGVQYASTTVKRCPMFDDACAARVIEQISAFYPCTGEGKPFDATALVEERCGRFVRGAHKGKLRGWASIEVVTEGGWKKHGPGERNGRVVYPGTTLGISIGDDFSGKTYLEVNFMNAKTIVTVTLSAALLAACAGPLSKVSPELRADILACEHEAGEARKSYGVAPGVLRSVDSTIQRVFERCMNEHGWRLRSER